MCEKTCDEKIYTDPGWKKQKQQRQLLSIATCNNVLHAGTVAIQLCILSVAIFSEKSVRKSLVRFVKVV